MNSDMKFMPPSKEHADPLVLHIIWENDIFFFTNRSGLACSFFVIPLILAYHNY